MAKGRKVISEVSTGIYLPGVCKARWDPGVLASCAEPPGLVINVLLLSFRFTLFACSV